MKAGLLFRIGSVWVGAHFSKKHRRVCINFLPCITLWIVLEGGDIPEGNGWV